MWLLQLHFSVSILCLLTVWGFCKVFKEQIKENGYTSEGKKKSFFRLIWIFFIPVLNIFMVIIMFIMLSTKKQDFDNYCEKRKREKESRE